MHGFNLDTARPQNRNDASFGGDSKKARSSGSAIHADHAHKKAGHKMKSENVPHAHQASREPQASSYPMPGIIMNVHRPGKGAVGVPGIINSTTTGNEVRQRLQLGVIESPAGIRGHSAEGPLHKAMGHDATAWNSGMAHISGSPFKH